MFWTNLSKITIFIISIIVIAFNAQLYIYCKQQRNEIDLMGDRQKLEAETYSHKFKILEDQNDRLNKDLEDAQQQIKDQDVILSDQKEDSKNVQTSLVDIKAEADAIKQDMKRWQKDDVSVLAEFEKKMDDLQDELKKIKADDED